MAMLNNQRVTNPSTLPFPSPWVCSTRCISLSCSSRLSSSRWRKLGQLWLLSSRCSTRVASCNSFRWSCWDSHCSRSRTSTFHGPFRGGGWGCLEGGEICESLSEGQYESPWFLMFLEGWGGSYGCCVWLHLWKPISASPKPFGMPHFLQRRFRARSKFQSLPTSQPNFVVLTSQQKSKKPKFLGKPSAAFCGHIPHLLLLLTLQRPQATPHIGRLAPRARRAPRAGCAGRGPAGRGGGRQGHQLQGVRRQDLASRGQLKMDD